MENVVQTLTVAIVILLSLSAFLIKPIRKTVGLLLVIIGAIICLTYVGMVIGIPMIFVGGILLFI